MKQISIILLLIGFLTDSIYGQLISGSVSFENYDEPATGTSVYVKGTNIGTVTDVEGNYTLRIDSTHKTLCFRYIGFENVDIDINNDTIINITLHNEPKVFDDFIVTAYIKNIKPKIYGAINGQTAKPTETNESTNKIKLLSIRKNWLDTTSYNDWTRAIYDNINYPDSAFELGIQGNVYAKFKIDNIGNMVDLEIINGVDKYLDNEVYEKLTYSPKWTQNDINRFAPIKGKYYSVIFILPVKFRIIEDEK